MPARRVRLRLLPETLAICRLDSDADIPSWLPRRGLSAVLRTAEELAIYAAEDVVPQDVQAARGWRALELMGPFDFSETGVIASVAGPLAEAGISISILATYDTDYLFVREEALEDAVEVLSAAGHRIVSRD
jgi:uncharacterized protein